MKKVDYYGVFIEPMHAQIKINRDLGYGIYGYNKINKYCVCKIFIMEMFCNFGTGDSVSVHCLVHYKIR